MITFDIDITQVRNLTVDHLKVLKLSPIDLEGQLRIRINNRQVFDTHQIDAKLVEALHVFVLIFLVDFIDAFTRSLAPFLAEPGAEATGD